MKPEINFTHVGWFSAQNFGDDLMAYALYKSLTIPGFKINYQLACESRPTLKGENLSWIYPFDLKRPNLRDLWIKVRKPYSDSMIVGGGSILRSSRGIGWKKKLYFELKKRNPKLKLSGFSLSIGDFINAAAEDEAKEFIKYFDFAYLRDKFSYDFFKQYNPSQNCILAFDAGASILENVQFFSGREEVGLCLMKAQDEIEKKAHIEIINELRSQAFKLHYFVFMSGTTGLESEDYQYVNNFKNDNEQVTFFDGDIDKFINEFNKMRFIVSARYHGMVLAHCLQIPFVGIPPIKVIKKGREVFNSFQQGFGDSNVVHLHPGIAKEIIPKFENKPFGVEMIQNSKMGVEAFDRWIIDTL